MKAALRDSYLEYVYFTGVTERYPSWFAEELYYGGYMNENKYTFYVPLHQRSPDYYEKTLIEDYTVFLRKCDGSLHVTDYDTFKGLYTEFTYNRFYNCGIAAFDEDCIEYVECYPGVLPAGYPEWFYEYFTEAIILPQECEGFMLFSNDNTVEVTDHCVFLLNKYGEIRGMYYDEFLKYYDPDPKEDEICRI